MAKCSVQNCNEIAMVCWIWGSEGEDEQVLYCLDHAEENGHCSSCGYYSAGTEEFDFVHPGTCRACYEEIQADIQLEDEIMAQEANDYLYFEPPY